MMTMTTISPSKPTTRALEILRALGRSSTAKYEAMANWIGEDDRVRGGLLFHGASTGRWSGQGVQPHNFPKGRIKDQEVAWNALKTHDKAVIAQLRDSKGQPFDGPMDALSSALRGVIIPREGYDLCVADYASIEARVLLWLAGETTALELFRTGGDIYLDMASEIYGYECNKQDHAKERGLGKIAILGLGYQMGASKFQATCEAQGIVIEDDLAERVVHAYRSKYWRVKRLWYATEEVACDAVTSGELRIESRIAWRVEGRFLYATLPSGRRLAYPDPEVRLRATPWGDMKPSLTFMGVDPHTHQWKRQTTYGGMLVENLVQAIARDIMADALMRCEQSGKYIPILTVHDELVTEVASGTGNAKEFERLLTDIPWWASGCPIAAEAWIGLRYTKR